MMPARQHQRQMSGRVAEVEGEFLKKGLSCSRMLRRICPLEVISQLYLQHLLQRDDFVDCN